MILQQKDRQREKHGVFFLLGVEYLFLRKQKQKKQ